MCGLSCMWCWQHFQHSKQHMQATREKEKLVNGRMFNPRHLSQTGLLRAYRGMTGLHGGGGNTLDNRNLVYKLRRESCMKHSRSSAMCVRHPLPLPLLATISGGWWTFGRRLAN